MKLLALLCLSWGATVPAAHQSSCTTSDDNLIALQHTICASLACNSESCPCGNITAAGDWPTQSIYMKNMLDALIDPETCLNTTTAKEIVAWMDVTDVNSSFWWWTWLVFQVQYYDMPRSPGDRIESPATLGRNCAPKHARTGRLTMARSGRAALQTRRRREAGSWERRPEHGATCFAHGARLRPGRRLDG